MTTRKIPPCDQCVAVMINNVYCHETGCPNTNRRWSPSLKKWVLGLLAIVSIGTSGCKSIPRPVQAHWGDRSSWQPHESWTQQFYADSDGHLFGYVEQYGYSTSVEANCRFGTRTNNWHNSLGQFETQLEAQAAVESQCLMEDPSK